MPASTPASKDAAVQDGAVQNAAVQDGAVQNAPPQYAGQQYSGPQYAGPPYAGQPAAYRTPKRPPLTPREKKGAFWAGAVGLNLLTVGFSLFVAPIVVFLFATFAAWAMKNPTQNSEGSDSNSADVEAFLQSIDFGTLTIIGVVVLIIGLAMMVAAAFWSTKMLRSAGVIRVWPVTWSAAGIAVFASWIFGQIPYFFAQVAMFPMIVVGMDGLTALLWAGIVGLVLIIGLNVIIGWLAWWWMTFAFRPATRDNTPTAVII